jgi:hypothetical protein
LFFYSESNAPPLNVDVVKLEECEEECDNTKREAKFALRTVDSDIWKPLSGGAGINTDMDPTAIQHWALVVHFPGGKKTYLFEAEWDENGHLQASRAEGVDYEIFEKAKYFGKIETSPKELLTKAKLVPTGEYFFNENNCQTWTVKYVRKLSSILLFRLGYNIPATIVSIAFVTLPQDFPIIMKHYYASFF